MHKMEKQKLSLNLKTALETVIRDNFEHFTLLDILKIFNAHPGLNIENVIKSIENEINRKAPKEEIIRQIRGFFNVLRLSKELENILNYEDHKFLKDFSKFCLEYISKNENELKFY